MGRLRLGWSMVTLGNDFVVTLGLGQAWLFLHCFDIVGCVTGRDSKGKINHTPQESIGRCSSPSPRPWARRWRTTNVWRMASATPDLWLPSQLQGITAHWLVPNYTAWWQRHMCVNNLSGVALDSGEARIQTPTCWSQVQCPNHSATEPHMKGFWSIKIPCTSKTQRFLPWKTYGWPVLELWKICR